MPLLAEPTATSRSDRWLSALDWPMAILALAVVPALVLENRATAPSIRLAANAVNWFIWLAFVGEFVFKLTLAERRALFIRQSWFDLAIIVLSPPFLVPEAFQNTRALRALRLLRVVRAVSVGMIGLKTARRLLRHHNLHYLAVMALGAVGLGAVAIYAVEGGVNRSIGSFGDALWWAIVTATTVGYGDVSPVTGEGRLVAVVLMLVGIGFVGAFTATVASLFLEHDRESERDMLEQRLDAIERKLDQLVDSRRGDGE